MPLSSGMALLSSYGQMALRICANILVHKVTFTIIFVRTWWSEHRPSDRARHFSLLSTTQGFLCASIWWTKNISVVVVVMSGFDLCWTQLVTSLSATAQGFFERSKPGLNVEQSSHRCWNSTVHISVVNPTHLVCMYLIKFVELETTKPWGVHLNKSRLDRKSDGHTLGIVMPVHHGGEV